MNFTLGDYNYSVEYVLGNSDMEPHIRVTQFPDGQRYINHGFFKYVFINLCRIVSGKSGGDYYEIPEKAAFDTITLDRKLTINDIGLHKDRIQKKFNTTVEL